MLHGHVPANTRKIWARFQALWLWASRLTLGISAPRLKSRRAVLPGLSLEPWDFRALGGVRRGGTPTAPHSEVARAGPAGHGCDTSDGKTAPGRLSETPSRARRCYEPDFGEVRFRKHHLGDLRFAFRGAVSSCSSSAGDSPVLRAPGSGARTRPHAPDPPSPREFGVSSEGDSTESSWDSRRLPRGAFPLDQVNRQNAKFTTGGVRSAQLDIRGDHELLGKQESCQAQREVTCRWPTCHPIAYPLPSSTPSPPGLGDLGSHGGKSNCKTQNLMSGRSPKAS